MTEEHCWGNHQYFFKDGKCMLDTHFCEDSPKCYLVAMEKYNISKQSITEESK